MQAELGGHEKAGTFSTGPVPEAANVFSAKWVVRWKTDADGTVTKAKARLVAQIFGQRFAVDYFETFAATPSMASIKLVIAVAIQEEWPLYHFDATQAFDVGMIQCEADPCVFKMEDAGDVRVIFVVHVDDILISCPEENVGKVGQILNKRFPRTISER
ncbi:unnamed protein product [Sphacelaria rigidula]